MTLEQHQKIAEWLTDPTIDRVISCDIPNTYGVSSRTGKVARRLYETVMSLRSEMEGRALDNGHRNATDLYYPSTDTFYPGGDSLPEDQTPRP